MEEMEEMEGRGRLGDLGEIGGLGTEAGIEAGWGERRGGRQKGRQSGGNCLLLLPLVRHDVIKMPVELSVVFGRDLDPPSLPRVLVAPDLVYLLGIDLQTRTARNRATGP